MPIVSTVSVSQEIASLKFRSDDTLEVEIIRTENGAATQRVYLLNAEIVRLLLDSPPLEGMTLRQSIICSIYQTLISEGLVSGEITA